MGEGVGEEGMSTYTYSPVADSRRAAHAEVELNGVMFGEVWREEVGVVSKGKRVLKWRWFGCTHKDPKVIGKHRFAMSEMSGFKTRNDAAVAVAKNLLDLVRV